MKDLDGFQLEVKEVCHRDRETLIVFKEPPELTTAFVANHGYGMGGTRLAQLVVDGYFHVEPGNKLWVEVRRIT